MQIQIHGEMSMAAVRQALFEMLHELETDHAVEFVRSTTLYVTPTDGKGHCVHPRQHGRALKKLESDGPYRSTAQDYKL